MMKNYEQKKILRSADLAALEPYLKAKLDCRKDASGCVDEIFVTISTKADSSRLEEHEVARRPSAVSGRIKFLRTRPSGWSCNNEWQKFHYFLSTLKTMENNFEKRNDRYILHIESPKKYVSREGK
jgi:hypothetical protein